MGAKVLRCVASVVLGAIHTSAQTYGTGLLTQEGQRGLPGSLGLLIPTHFPLKLQWRLRATDGPPPWLTGLLPQDRQPRVPLYRRGRHPAQGPGPPGAVKHP